MSQKCEQFSYGPFCSTFWGIFGTRWSPYVAEDGTHRHRTYDDDERRYGHDGTEDRAEKDDGDGTDTTGRTANKKHDVFTICVGGVFVTILFVRVFMNGTDFLQFVVKCPPPPPEKILYADPVVPTRSSRADSIWPCRLDPAVPARSGRAD